MTAEKVDRFVTSHPETFTAGLRAWEMWGDYLSVCSLKTRSRVQSLPTFQSRDVKGVQALTLLEDYFLKPSLLLLQCSFLFQLHFGGFMIREFCFNDSVFRTTEGTHNQSS
jgi:hypothetical protein